MTAPNPAYLDESVIDFAESTGLWEHDLRHGIRSASKTNASIELRKLAHTEGSGVSILVEQKFTMPPVFLGFIDLIVIDRREGQLKVSVHDHKFMSNKQSVMSEDEARRDYQTLIYAKAVLSFFPIDSVTFSFDYYGTTYAWSENLKFSLTRSEVDDKWSSVLGDTGRVLDNYKVPCGTNTTPNYFGCSMYGGCEYKDICFGDEPK